MKILLLFLCLLPQKDEGCKRCDFRGMVPCGEHSEELHAFEERVQFCSLIAACETCAGTLMADCPRCDGGPDHAVAAARRQAIEAWLVETPLEQHMGRALPRIETPSHELIVDTGTLKEGRKKVDAHVLSHRVADDVEHVARRMAEHFRLTSVDYRSKMRMWIWNNLADHSKAMTKFFETGSTGDFKMLGVDPVFSVWTEPSLFDDVHAVRSLFAHNAAHMLLSNALFPLWIGDLGGGWLDAGVGHWYEYEIFERSSNYCIEESTARENYENGVWRAAIRKRLESAAEPLLPRLFELNTGAMRQSEQALCWSFYDYLLAVHPRALRAILTELKGREMETRAILPQELGLDVFQADAAWRAWVSRVYPKRGDKPRPADPDD